MKEDLKLEKIEQGDFLGTVCDFYKDGSNQIYMTREQIGEALDYSNNDDGIRRMHNRKANKDRLDKFSSRVALTQVEGSREVTRDTVIYTERGIYEICRISKQPVADDFYDWVYDKVSLLRQTSGVVNEGEEKQFLDNYFPTLSEGTKLMMVKDLNNSIKEQQEKILELQPKANDWSAFQDAKGNISISHVAKALNIKGLGRNKLFELLRTKKILMTGNEPYQRFVDAGYFEVIMTEKNFMKFPKTLVTGKGMSYINKKVKEWGYVTS